MIRHSPLRDPADVEAISRILSEMGIDDVLPSNADTTRVLADHRGSLSATCHPITTQEALDCMND